MDTNSHEPPPRARARLAAGALFLDAAGRVMLVRPSYKEHWEIPGGGVEPGESPYAACVREIREELGIAPHVGRMLVVDWAPAGSEDDGSGDDRVRCVFDGGSLSDDELSRIVFVDGEITEFRYVEPGDLDDLVPARLARRLRAALVARRQARTIYAEHGIESPPPQIP